MVAQPVWLARMSSQGRALAAHVAQQCGVPAQAALIEEVVSNAPRTSRDTNTSRQARHAQLARARSTVAAGALILAAENPDVRAFVLSRDYPWLRPFNAEMQFKWPSFARMLPQVTEERAQTLFEAGQRELMDLAPRVATLDQLDLLRVHSAILCAFVGPLIHRTKFADAWRSLYEEAAQRGLLENPQLRIRLSALGGWVGHDAGQIESVFDSKLRDTGLADAYCFVRTDTREDVYVNTAALIRGDHVDPAHCLLPGRPGSTLRQAVDYIRASLRDAEHMRSPGQALYLLAGLSEIERHARELVGSGLLGVDSARVLERLRGVGSLQLMEKRRFWALCDGLPEGRLKERLQALWLRDFGHAPAPTTQRDQSEASVPIAR